jgi:hypothetical protein
MMKRLLLALFVASLPALDAAAQAPAAAPPGPIRRLPDGKPDLNGFFQSDHGGANWGLEPHKETFTGGGRGVIIDPPDKKLPYQPWAAAERASRNRPERGYDDPTAHCFVGGVPRSLYVPAPVHIFQTAEAVVFLHERMAWRLVSLDRTDHLPDTLRLWQGDSIGRWEGDTLVVETRNLNGKSWLNEVGDVISHAATVVERFTPVNANRITYQATVTDLNVYTRPWTIEMPLNRQPGEMLEVACLEDNQDLKHLKDVRDEFRRQNSENK